MPSPKLDAVAWADPKLSPPKVATPTDQSPARIAEISAQPPAQGIEAPRLFRRLQDELVEQRARIAATAGAPGAVEIARQLDRALLDLFAAGAAFTRAARFLELGRCS